MYVNFIYAYLYIYTILFYTVYINYANYICAILVLLAYWHKYCARINNQLYGNRDLLKQDIIESVVIESVDSISRDEWDVPLTQYITNA